MDVTSKDVLGTFRTEIHYRMFLQEKMPQEAGNPVNTGESIIYY